MAMLRESLQYVLSEYAQARHAPFAGNSVAKYIRKDLASAVREYVETAPLGELFLVEGSAGQGVWANVPWVAVFNHLLTDSAQDGYYVVYLFRHDLKGVFLSLNQGVTTVLERYKATANEALRARAKDFRARLGKLGEMLHADDINLGMPKNTRLVSGYEAGAVLSKYYSADALPSEEALRADLTRFLDLYLRLDGSVASELVVEEDQAEYFEDTSKLSLHTRIERNQKLIRSVKKAQGYRCQACGFDFAKKYGEIGSEFIEAHHLMPLAQLADGKIKLDPREDFAVLCANCHRMIHRTDCINDVAAFRERHLLE